MNNIKQKAIVLNHLQNYINEFSKKNPVKIIKYYKLPVNIYDNKRYVLKTKSNFLNYFNLIYFFLNEKKYRFTKIINIKLKFSNKVFIIKLLARRFFKIKKNQNINLVYRVILIKNKPKITGFSVKHEK